VLRGLPERIEQQIGRDWHSGSLGTGFLVNADGYVMTAQHVINAGRALSQQTGAQQVRLVIGVAAPPIDRRELQVRGNFVHYEFETVDGDPRHDLALLKPKANPFTQSLTLIKLSDQEISTSPKIAAITRERPRDGAAVAVSGYPLGEPVLVTNAGWMASVWSYNTVSVTIPGMPEWLRLPDSADSYLADLTANPGNSGGPIYLAENGAVIGVCIASKPTVITDEQNQPVTVDGRKLRYSAGLTIVVPAEYVVALLEKNSLTWSEANH
jgi:S1-C subfamily serine protease